MRVGRGILAAVIGLGCLGLWRAAEGRRAPHPSSRARPLGMERPQGPGGDGDASPSRSARLGRALQELERTRGAVRGRAAARARLAAATCYRADGRFLLARAHLEQVAAQAPLEERLRAQLELAHLARRVGDLEGARARYADIAFGAPGVDPRPREAALWAWAAMESALGEPRWGARLWITYAAAALAPVDRVRAWRRVLRHCLHNGHRDAAWWLLIGCHALFQEHARERTVHGERVRAALRALGDEFR